MGDLIANLLGLAQQDPAGARGLIEKIVKASPRSLDARRLRAQIHAYAGDLPGALREYEAAAAMAPSAADFPCRLGAARAETGRYDLAYEAYRRAWEGSGGAFAAAMTASMLHRLGRIQEALDVGHRALLKVSRSDPERWGLLRLLTRLLRDGGAPLAAERIQQDLLLEYQAGSPVLATWLLERDAVQSFPDWRTHESLDTLARAIGDYAAEAHGALAFPDTFRLPAERGPFEAYAAASPQARFVVRAPVGPTRTLRLAQGPSSLGEGESAIAQRRVERPLLMGGRRAELRIFVCVTSHAPLRAYVFREGLAYLAPGSYDEEPDTLLGYATPAETIAVSSGRRPDVWRLSEYWRALGAEDERKRPIWTRIRSLASHFLRSVAGQGLFQKQASHPLRAFAPKLFALDFTLDAATQPWLMAYRENWRRAEAKESALYETLSRAVFEMTTFCVLDDRIAPDALSGLLRDKAAFLTREAAGERALSGEFEAL